MTDHTRRPSALELLDKVRSARAVLMRHPDQARGNSVVHYAYHACDSIEQGLILLDIDIIILQRRLQLATAALDKIAQWEQGEQVNGAFDEPTSAHTARTTLVAIKAV